MEYIETHHATRPCIMIVDDMPANLGVLLDFLDTAGYEVLVAESGEGSLAQLEYAQPDIILLDVSMPGIDGYETCQRLKAEARWRNTPVFFVTALNDPEDKVRGFAAGAVDYITKPLHPEEVLARVQAHLRIKTLQNELEERNALLRKAVEFRLEAEAQLQQSLDRAVLVVHSGHQIQFCTQLARHILERHFPAHQASSTLPKELIDWVAQEPRTNLWQRTVGDFALEARLFTDGAAGGCVMLTLEETSLRAQSPAVLLGLGLTMRKAEVLYWIAQGKTNPEVALILQAALNTIKKHVQNILLKLGVETRLAAALRAAELLETGAVDPVRFQSERTA